ncbi:MAG: helix-hairpin-helix domain-containing protein [Saccharofermentanales bacterium]
MQNKLSGQKQAEDAHDRKLTVINKVILFAVIILLFSGIAILSFFIEKPESDYTLINIKSNNSSSGLSSVSSDLSSHLSGEVISGELQYPVYIVGEIRKPGIYQIRPGMFLYQVVEMAGGLTPKAARNHINLAFQIIKNQMIKIPSIDEVNSGNLGGVEDGLLLNDPTGIDNSSDSDGIDEKVNINTASADELDKLPGIGAATAKLIVDFRTRNGEFKLIEDIMKISGIKVNKFNQIKDQITVG